MRAVEWRIFDCRRIGHVSAGCGIQPPFTWGDGGEKTGERVKREGPGERSAEAAGSLSCSRHCPPASRVRAQRQPLVRNIPHHDFPRALMPST